MSRLGGQGDPVGCKPAAFRRTASSILAACTLALCACASSPLPAISTGLDAARAGIKGGCPARTDTCERIVAVFNQAENAYNLAVIAEAVHRDSKALANSALGYLESVLTALTSMGAQNELASDAGISPQ